MKLTTLIIALSSLAACAAPDRVRTGPDQCLRARLFKECLAAVPAGPTRVVANDWSEVVSECASTAYYQSLRPLDQVEPKCRVEN